MNASIQAQITKVSGKATTDKGGAIRRFCTLELLHEFDGEIADAIGPAARKLLRPMTDLEISKADIPIDASTVQITLDCVEADGLRRSVSVIARGVTAKIRGGKEDRAPSVKLTFSFAFDREVWGFLGANYASTAKVDIVPAQLELPVAASNGGVKEEESAGNGRKKGRGRKAAAEANDETPAETH